MIRFEVRRNIILASAVLLLVGCQQSGLDVKMDNPDGIVGFIPTVSNTGVMTKAQYTSDGQGINLCSEDGEFGIPVSCSSQEGIGSFGATSGGIATKGALINEYGPGPVAFDTDRSFFVKAWDGSTSANIIPGSAAGSYQKVDHNGTIWHIPSKTYIWKEDETKTFYAYSNLPASGASVSNSDATGQTLTYTVPTTAAAQSDILMGFYSGAGETGSPATMTGTASIFFSHPLTAVKFELGVLEGVTSFAVNSISIEKVYASGTAVMTPSTASQSDPKDRFVWTPSSSVITVSQSIGTQPTSSAPQIGEAFLLIPQTFGASSESRIVLNCTIDDSKTIDLYYRLKSDNWKAGYTNTYLIGFDGHTYEYNFSFSDAKMGTQTFSNTSTDETRVIEIISNRTNDDDVTQDAEFIIKGIVTESSGEVSVGGQSFEDIGGVSAEIDADGNLSVTSLAREPISPGGHDYWVNKDDISGDTDGTGWSPKSWEDKDVIDLSRFNFKTETTNNPMTTANCYVIRHAGTYKIPLVYGNAIVNGAFNEQSYYAVPKVDYTAYSYMDRFINHLGYGITNPFIEYNTTDGKAKSESNSYLAPADGADGYEIVWQDNAKLITIDGITKESVTVRNASGTSETFEVSYLTFTIPQDKICQNNAILAVKDASGQIMWSWHIWTTNNPALLSNAITVTNKNGNDYDFFPLYALGWIDATNYYANEDIVVLMQNKTGAMLEVKVRQLDVIGLSKGCYYQYGRKDPLCRTDNPVDGKYVKKSSYTTLVDYAESIKYPGMFLNEISGHNWCTPCYVNLWSGRSCNIDTEKEQDDSMIKTIYDPSPAGYKIPPTIAFSGLANSKLAYINGYIFYTTTLDKVTDSTPTIFFPTCGLRHRSNGNLAGGEGSYVSCTAGSNYCGTYYYRGYDNGGVGGPISYNSLGYGRCYSFSARPVLE